MRAEAEDHLQPAATRGGISVTKLLLALAILAAVLVFWYWGTPQEPAPQAPPTAAPAAQPKAIVPATPDIPRKPEPAPAVAEEADIVEAQPEVVAAPPTAAEIDAIVLEQFDLIGMDSMLPRFASSEHPLDLSTALLSGLGRGIVLRKLLPADPPRQAFVIEQNGESLYMSSSSYARYDSYAASIAALDVDAVVSSFHLLRPLYEHNFEGAGLEADDFDNTVVRTLDIVLATPEIDGPIELQQKSVLYHYVDPQLEALSSVQKQLLRMGPDNIRLIKQQAQLLRDALLAQPPEEL